MHPKLSSAACLGLLWLATLTASQAQQPQRLDLRKADHIALIGNALPDRMQHTGYFETLLHAQFPQHQLVVRNLAAAGDEVANRHRSENFGTPDDWLNRVRADVIIAFFGYAESTQGPDALPKFRADLDKYLKETATKDFSGRGRPRQISEGNCHQGLLRPRQPTHRPRLPHRQRKTSGPQFP